MKKSLLLVVVVVLLLTGVVVADKAESCGFVCKVTKLLKKIFNIDQPGKEELLVPEPSPVEPEPEVPAVPDEVLPDGQGDLVDTRPDPSTPPEAEKTPTKTKKEAIEEQVQVTAERAVESILQNIDVKHPQCTLFLESSSVKGGGYVNSRILFTNEDWKYKQVDVSCDQFERYGTSADKPFRETIPSSLEIENRCDWGRVTTPTVYFIIVADVDGLDLCAAPITVIPGSNLQLGRDGCLSEDVLRDMKEDCESKDLTPFSIPDEHNCETVYCTSDVVSLCAPEAALEQAEEECHNQGENFLANRYSEEVEGQDWPCAQIRCSECPSTEDLEASKGECSSLGDGWSAAVETDYETTGCKFVVCNEPESSAEALNHEELEINP